MIKLSIIIPYYQTYDYTIKLLKELEIQKTEEVEVILVDDGCNETRFDIFKYATIIHLDKNYGASYAWNVGIKKAIGKYIAFIDSDDMISMDYVEELIKAIDHEYADEIIFDWIDSTFNYYHHKPNNRAIWKAIYKRDKIPMFDETWYCETDLAFQNRLSEIEHTKFYLNKTLYFYRSRREGSITWRRLRGQLKRKKDEV